MAWTAEQVTTLRTKWAEGLSAREVGAVLGVSRNAVISKLNRIERPARTAPQRRGPIVRRKPKVKPMRETPEAVTPLNVPFLARASAQCKAITDSRRGEQKCCGHPIDTADPQMRGYCAYHRSIYYQHAPSKAR